MHIVLVEYIIRIGTTAQQHFLSSLMLCLPTVSFRKLVELTCLVQEVLLILEECWSNSPELQNVPIYQASGLARRAISVYQTYIEMMNDDIKAAFQVSTSATPFPSRHNDMVSSHLIPTLSQLICTS